MARRNLRDLRHPWADRDLGTGRFEKGRLCDGCGRPVGSAHFTDDEVCGSTDGPGFYVCDRPRCRKRLEPLSVEERRAIYTAQRAENDRKEHEEWERRKQAEAAAGPKKPSPSQLAYEAYLERLARRKP